MRECAWRMGTRVHIPVVEPAPQWKSVQPASRRGARGTACTQIRNRNWVAEVDMENRIPEEFTQNSSFVSSKIGAWPEPADSSTAGHAFCRGGIAFVNSLDLDTTNCLRWCLIYVRGSAHFAETISAKG